MAMTRLNPLTAARRAFVPLSSDLADVVENTLNLEALVLRHGVRALHCVNTRDPLVTRLHKMALTGASSPRVRAATARRIEKLDGRWALAEASWMRVASTSAVAQALGIMVLCWASVGTRSSVLFCFAGLLWCSLLMLRGCLLFHPILQRVMTRRAELREARQLHVEGLLGILDGMNRIQLLGHLRRGVDAVASRAKVDASIFRRPVLSRPDFRLGPVPVLLETGLAGAAA